MTTHDAPTPEEFDLRSLDLAAEKRAELLRLFPECATEGGKVDFERLKAALGEQIDAGKERYGLTWPGKAACFQTIQRPSLATLRPKPGESVDFDTTQNVIIEGDNLEVLKLLQKSYLGKVKMIYIDPPYNTGNDFIYPDNYTESLQTYLEYTGQVDAEGRKFSTNTEADGRFHSKWLNMMYPRLYLARNLLREDGFLLCSIDDAEMPNLLRVLDDVFGEENRLAVLIYDKNRKNDARYFSVGHEYMIVVARSKSQLDELKVVLRASKEGIEEVRAAFDSLRKQHGDNWPLVTDGIRDLYASWKSDDPRKPLERFSKVDGKGPYRDDGDISWPGGGGPRYEVLHPRTGRPCKVPSRGWVYPKQTTMLAKIADGTVAFGNDETSVPSLRSNLFESTVQVMRSVHFSYAQTTTQGLAKLFDGARVFDNPKSESDLARLINYLTDESALILDFFAGSGTTAHAVLEQNKKDGGNRKFLLVQLPEPTGRTDYPTIADITKERVRRVIKNLNDADKGQLRSANDPKPDRGFRVFQLAPSNFKPWDGDRSKDAGALKQQLLESVEHVLPDRSEQDLLYEILLKDGFELTTPIETCEVHGFRVHSVAGGELLLCLQDKLTLDLIKALADKKPSRVVFLDRGFRGNDQLKANAAKLFASKAGDNFKKFKTV
ncbi:MAG: site-specific DNA-methyltransferase [Phycisphaerae bacterium]